MYAMGNVFKDVKQRVKALVENHVKADVRVAVQGIREEVEVTHLPLEEVEAVVVVVLVIVLMVVHLLAKDNAMVNAEVIVATIV